MMFVLLAFYYTFSSCDVGDDVVSPPHMIEKHFGCTAIHNKALYNTSFIHSFIHVRQTWTQFPPKKYFCAVILAVCFDSTLIKVWLKKGAKGNVISICQHITSQHSISLH